MDAQRVSAGTPGKWKISALGVLGIVGIRSVADASYLTKAQAMPTTCITTATAPRMLGSGKSTISTGENAIMAMLPATLRKISTAPRKYTKTEATPGKPGPPIQLAAADSIDYHQIYPSF